MRTGNQLIADFVESEIRPHLAKDYLLYKKRDLVRLHGSFVQLLAMSFSRSGTLRVHPSFFVVGADLSLSVIPQNVSLEVLDPGKWSIPGAALTPDLGERLVRQLENFSPLSFVAPMSSVDDAAISKLFQFFDKKTSHWSASLYHAHYLLCNNQKQADFALRRARAHYERLGGKIIGQPPPWRTALGQRLIEMERKLTLPDSQFVSRAESEQQAAELSLPKIVWN